MDPLLTGWLCSLLVGLAITGLAIHRRQRRGLSRSRVLADLRRSLDVYAVTMLVLALSVCGAMMASLSADEGYAAFGITLLSPFLALAFGLTHLPLWLVVVAPLFLLIDADHRCWRLPPIHAVVLTGVASCGVGVWAHGQMQVAADWPLVLPVLPFSLLALWLRARCLKLRHATSGWVTF